MSWRAVAAGGEQDGSGEEAAKLPTLVEVKKELSPPPAMGCYLGVLITRPDSEMPGCKAWPAFCYLEAYVDGNKLVDLKLLPIARGDVVAEENEVNAWGLSLVIPMGSGWQSQSLDLLVRRLDFVPMQGDGDRRQLIRGGPHTSHGDAVIGTARVNLVDALLVVDENVEGKDGKKRRCDAVAEGYIIPRMKATHEFSDTVTLLDWEVTAPPLGTAGSAQHLLVSRGTVNVRMAMFHA